MNRHKTLTIGLAGALGLAAPMISQAEEACQLYGVNDGGLNDSQLFTVNSDTHEVETLGSLHEGKDIEALAINKTGVLYAASGDDTEQKGHLYTVDKGTGALTDLGSTGFKEIEGLTFDSDGKLWAWAKGDGLISIDPSTPSSSTLELPSSAKVEDITWNPEGTQIYGSQNTNLWVYDKANNSVQLKCSNLPGETEALEMLPDGTLLLGIHGKKEILQFNAFDVETCTDVASVDIPTSSSLNDVEGIAWQCNDVDGEDGWRPFDPNKESVRKGSYELRNCAEGIKLEEFDIVRIGEYNGKTEGYSDDEFGWNFFNQYGQKC